MPQAGRPRVVGPGYRGRVSTDEEPRVDSAASPNPERAASAPSQAGDDADPGSRETTAMLGHIESKPLAERARDYQTLADRLRNELERSDPSLGSG